MEKLLESLEEIEKKYKGKFEEKNISIPDKFIFVGELEKDSFYYGTCRNASFAFWDGIKFTYVRYGLGGCYLEDINHIDDDDGYDCFYPIEKLI
jgi:hypothetical protein